MFPAARSKSALYLSVDWSGLPTSYVCVWYSVRQKCFPETMCVRGYEAPQLWARGAARARRDAWSGRHPVRTRSGAAAGLRGRRGSPRAEARAARCGQRRRKGWWWEKGKARRQRERGPGTGGRDEGRKELESAPARHWPRGVGRRRGTSGARLRTTWLPTTQVLSAWRAPRLPPPACRLGR